MTGGPRTVDGSAGDADYGQVGGTYSQYRRPDPRIAAAITEALGKAHRVLNVGAGAGSYEPTDRVVTAVEPSETMRVQRPSHLAKAIDATAEALPFGDNSFDAAMTTFSVHQWSDLAAGLAELRRVTTGPIVILTCDPALLDRFWLNDYAPQVVSTEARRYPSVPTLHAILGQRTRVEPVPIPLDCLDGFNEAYYGRPEALLDPAARLACSSWSFLDAAAQDRFSEHLERDLNDGTWDRRHGHLRRRPFFDGSLILVISDAADDPGLVVPM